MPRSASFASLALLLALPLSGACREDPKPPPPREQPSPVATEAMSAPGTTELKNLGCDAAIVLDMQKRMSATGGKLREGEPRYVVTCQVAGARAKSPPTCDAVAGTYMAAVKTPDGSFNANVVDQATGKRICSHLYAPTGADLGPFGAQ